MRDEHRMWILAGGALGWAAFTLLGINEQRRTIVSIIIGAIGGVIGGQMVAPMTSSAPIVSGGFKHSGAVHRRHQRACVPLDPQHDRTARRRPIAVARGAADRIHVREATRPRGSRVSGLALAQHAAIL